MMHDDSDLLEISTPRIFTDGTKVYEQLGREYVQHSIGYFILAPSGAGKTYFIDRQKEPHWIDGDHLWMKTNAHPKGAWWKEDLQTIIEIDQRCDVITTQAKRLGFWIIGSSNDWLIPDAFVVPEWETHKKYISTRENGNYDGGATSKNLKRVQNHREWMIKQYKDSVPMFETVEEAADYLSIKSPQKITTLE